MHGLVYIVDPTVQQPWLVVYRSVSLLSVRATASIKHLSASVKLVQEYQNETNETQDCSYVFPVPDRAAVCAFEMVKHDGTKVKGIVKEKQVAKKEYDEAKDEGKLASLLVQETPDTFQMLVGNLLPQERVTIQLEYVTELIEDEQNDSIRFHLPMHIGQRYGENDFESSSSAFQASTSNSTFFDLTTSIEAVSAITKITCPSHTVSTELGPDASIADKVPAQEVPNFATVSFSSPRTLVKDFVLSIVAKSSDTPRCIAERHPSNDSSALSITLVPKFNAPEFEEQEYLFLVDRSGSMGGDRISMAKKALVVLLRSLPSRKGTQFNLVSFGSQHEALWKSGSRVYDQATLDRATKLVDSMDADFGGTEMKAALEATFSLRRTTKPTSVFLLTDGDAWDLSTVFDTVRKAVGSAGPKAPLRVFVLGIGNSASTAMCEGIARVGNGTCQFVIDGESFTGKTARLLKAAKSKPFSKIEIGYGAQDYDKVMSSEADEEGDKDSDFEMVDHSESAAQRGTDKKEPVSLFDASVDPLESKSSPPPKVQPVVLAPAPRIQQAPGMIKSLYSGSRMHVYAILDGSVKIPQEVVLRAQSFDGDEFELNIPVLVSPSPSSSIHVTAAKKLIQAFEDTSTTTDQPLRNECKNQAEIVRLGTTYSIASSHTSFIAVDESGSLKERTKRQVARFRNSMPPTYGGLPAGAASRCGMRMLAACAPPPPGGAVPMSAFSVRAPAPGGMMARAAPIMMMAQAKSSTRFTKKDEVKGGGPGLAPNSVRGGGGMLLGAPRGDKMEMDFSIPSSPPPPAETDSDRLDQIARTQAFDGSFDQRVLQVLRFTKLNEEWKTQVGVQDEGALIALLVLAYWRKHLSGLEEEWEALALKARDFVKGRLGFGESEIEDLVKTAETVL
ncbi:BQ2448_3314 [Microbotryum intermedium]|uniref:BQ2448_3314 protein n=1 Tax=Microbotryum intermedium TaxID=269621 RepID=A0A238F9K7_9BASI|nr:BQ2448_3314 [Microbotryum intermedium]